MQQAYHHIEALEHVADEIAKSLKPGGIFAISDYIGANFLQRTPRRRASAARSGAPCPSVTGSA